MAYYPLPSGRLHKKNKKSSNLLKNSKTEFYENRIESNW